MNPDSHYDPDRIDALTVTTPGARAQEGLGTALYYEMLIVKESG
jgi:hypothetical protein